jgi:hypothetical protein
MREFLKQAFTDGGTPSSSRLLSAFCTIASIGWITHIVAHTHAMPDVATIGGATAFSVAHYSANRLTQK